MSQKKKALHAAFPHTIPVLTGFSILGIAYGILMSSKGYGVLWCFLMSAIAFCGSMQFVAITLLTTVFNPIQAFFLSLMVNARHLFYGISMISKYRGIGKIKALLIFFMCDETFSITSTTEVPEGVDRKWFYLYISLLNYIYWVVASVIGGLIGNMIHFETKGLDFVLTALFIVIFLNQWKDPANRFSALLGVGVSTICLVVFGPDKFIIPSMIGILLILTIFRKQLDTTTLVKEEDHDAN